MSLIEGGKSIPTKVRLKTSNRSVWGRKSDGYILTRDRKHGFTWLPRPTIYSTLNSDVTESIEETDEFKVFASSCLQNACRKVILTDDLGYLVSITYKEVPFLGHSQKALCYNIKNDKCVEFEIKGFDESEVVDAHDTEKGLVWQVCLNPRDVQLNLSEGRWAILNSSSNIIFLYSVPTLPNSDYRVQSFWDPYHNHVWILHVPYRNGQGQLDASLYRQSLTNGDMVKCSLLFHAR